MSQNREEKTIYFYGINKDGEKLEEGNTIISINTGDAIDMDWLRDGLVSSLYEAGVRDIVVTEIT